MASRVQRSRNVKPGIPSGAVYVGRPSQWGNPAKIGEYFKPSGEPSVLVENNYVAVDLFYQYCKRFAIERPLEFYNWVFPLFDKNLCCWCGLREVCHADVLLFIARKIKELSVFPDAVERIPAAVERWPALSDFIKI